MQLEILTDTEVDMAIIKINQDVQTVPASITPRQGMLILSRYGLLNPVQASLANMEGQAGVEARIDFERANEWRRDWPLLVGMATQYGLSSTQIDQMFIEASEL